MNAFVVSGLIKRRAQLAGDIEKAHEALRGMVLDLENLDATGLSSPYTPKHHKNNKRTNNALLNPG